MKNKKGVEFIGLMALLMSLVALSIDAMLPALAQIGMDLVVARANDTQMVISVFFIGMSLGLMLYGPYSDSFGRKNALYLGIAIFIVGCFIAMFATTFAALLAGRFCQGFGVCCCRVVSLAMIRDRLEGREMARVMSLIMVLFIIVPALAPAIGQVIIFLVGWRGIFGFVLVMALIGAVWMYRRQEETLEPEKRRVFSLRSILSGVWETVTNRITHSYTLAAGIIFGGFVGYLNTAQQLLQIHYRLGDAFSLYFGVLAIALGISSFITSRFVVRYGVELLSFIALSVLSLVSLLFFVYAANVVGNPRLLLFMGYLVVAFFCFGVLFGGFNTLAIQPLGHIAGVATSVISSVQTLVSAGVGGIIGWCYNDTVLPLVAGFFCCAMVSLAIMLYVRYWVCKG